MSGGSFGYLYQRDRHNLLEDRMLEYMANKLDKDHPGSAAAKATREAVDAVHLILDRLDRDAALRRVWHAIEWAQSCDWGHEEAKAAILAYVGPNTKPEDIDAAVYASIMRERT